MQSPAISLRTEILRFLRPDWQAMLQPCKMLLCRLTTFYLTETTDSALVH